MYPKILGVGIDKRGTFYIQRQGCIGYPPIHPEILWHYLSGVSVPNRGRQYARASVVMNSDLMKSGLDINSTDDVLNFFRSKVFGSA